MCVTQVRIEVIISPQETELQLQHYMLAVADIFFQCGYDLWTAFNTTDM